MGMMLLLFMWKESGFIFGRPFAQGLSSSLSMYACCCSWTNSNSKINVK